MREHFAEVTEITYTDGVATITAKEVSFPHNIYVWSNPEHTGRLTTARVGQKVRIFQVGAYCYPKP